MTHVAKNAPYSWPVERGEPRRAAREDIGRLRTHRLDLRRLRVAVGIRLSGEWVSGRQRTSRPRTP